MIDLNFLLNCVNLEILAICLIVGYLIKHTTPIKNKYIPSIVTILGFVLAIASANFGIALDVAVMGLVSGILSTGLHQTFKNFLQNKNNK